MDFVWLVPRATQQRGLAWLASQGGVSSLRLIDSRKNRFVRSVKDLRALGWDSRRVTICINLSTLPYLSSIRTHWTIWFVQGIPEERQFRNPTAANRARTIAWWTLLSFLEVPDVTAVVAAPMKELIEEKLRKHNVVVIPNSVADEAFLPPPTDAPTDHVVTYMGSGAAWQNLDHLRVVWSHLSEIDPAIRFRVISNDPRSAALVSTLPTNSYELSSAWQPSEVAKKLENSSAGFLLRTAELVNQVSCPVKFAEYLAASVPVVTTDMRWDMARLVRETGCGLLLSPSQPPQHQARNLADWLGSDAHRDARSVAQEVARTRSDSAIGEHIKELMP